ncbi:putative late blight resistance protein homolog R1A-3 [Salvia splendens]|uniref:putative late blight resistance protein homolog R1A-3 n=1 Tax=Salvia splendens TaxID=180675 RepID=UPI001C279D40|nr:putative late blight resistance protein homolog R1A-3 [Salvia splendens]
MAAYAALLSLMRLIDDIENHHSPPISLDKHQIQSLTENVTFLQEFLEPYKSPLSESDEADPLEMCIADAAYAAEDVIESHIVDKIQHSRPKATKLRNVSSKHDDKPAKLYEDVQNVIDEMDRIKAVAMETNTDKVVVLHDQPCRLISSSTRKQSGGMMVFSDHVLHGIMEKLMSYESGTQVIPITGMGGIGKTALAQTVYSQKAINEHFDICAWATISEQYNTREILCELVSQSTNKDKEKLSGRSEAELGLELHKSLFGRRFLIVMDDMWNIESWEEIQPFFPNNENHSRIMVTTRLSHLSSQLNNHYSHSMEFLDESSSWILLSKTVFGEEHFPLELEKVGKEIANNCRGLPLSIVVVGVYLKPCFLYMGVFEEDDAIRVSTLVKLWVCEGFLKPVDGKSLETIGKIRLKDLVDRNLILVDKLGSTGNIKRVKVHDLLRDICMNQGKKEGFYHVIGESSPRGINSQRRVVIRKNTSKKKVHDDFKSMSHVRSIIREHGKLPKGQNFGLLRTLHAYKFRYYDDESYVNSRVSGYVNLRHLAVEVARMSSIFSSFGHLWNLQTLIVYCESESTAPTEIWKMPQLRHIAMNERRLILPDPSTDDVVMENLEVLKGVLNFKCDEEVVKRIPNINKLEIMYEGRKGTEHDDYYCMGNFECLGKLEYLNISFWYDFRGSDLYKLMFPQNLKSLTLSVHNGFEWEMMLEKIGSLPLLEKFKLYRGRFRKGKWEIYEDQFPSLKYLELCSCESLTYWTTKASSIFPLLETLYLFNLDGLENIPSEIGYIPTLQIIQMDDCRESVVKCAKELVDEQMDLNGDNISFNVHVWLPFFKNEEAVLRELQSLSEFLQAYKSPVSDRDEADPLEMRIADAAYAAEDVIESHIVHNIQLSRSRSFFNSDLDDEQIRLYQGVQTVIEEMDRIKRVAIETNTEKVVVYSDQRHGFVSSYAGKKSSNMMVFSDQVLHKIMEKLVADEPGRQVIPITGIGGIGKTALAQTVYSKQVIKERFDICAWATISEQYNTREILCELVSQATTVKRNN